MGEGILVIEDEAAIRSILSDLLTSAGYEVTLAADGLEGLARFHSQHFDLVLLDIMLPKLDGYGVCEAIRRESSVPVIMLTALEGEEAQIRAFELRADDYITKPFSLKLVLMRVAAVLRRTGEDTPPLLRFKRICLNPVKHTVHLNGEPVSLTPLEYELLALFLRNPNRLFTRENLLLNVWGYNYLGDEKVVNLHIMNLRRKLGASVIETIRGVGYRLGTDTK